jgi:RecJ-like exonuclease
MSAQCPACGGRGTVASDCPYCRDSDGFEHHDLNNKSCPSCEGAGYVEEACPVCGGRGAAGHFLKVS